ncbi:hypothetical protein CSV69_16120 [Sporosarcina sp. P26b]|uniref:hypothetical protein n=1 Tax=Sporosarcina sp. P26b TaxID=2048253 RepID=UPI000C167B06|nr:hypothetical protein [Sporosarcina sp. P26b]PIC94565.1 hypothetical protein CSV69_16120 [Sporosarcina sp. P26b]
MSENLNKYLIKQFGEQVIYLAEKKMKDTDLNNNYLGVLTSTGKDKIKDLFKEVIEEERVYYEKTYIEKLTGIGVFEEMRHLQLGEEENRALMEKIGELQSELKDNNEILKTLNYMLKNIT